MSNVVTIEAERRVPRRSRRPSFTLVVSFLVLGIVAGLALLGPLIAPHDPNAQDLLVGLTKPSSHFWFGTDDLGRDVFSRTIVGARSAVVGPLLIAFGSFVIGNVLGLIAGYRGGLTDSLIMRWVDLMYALPGLLVAIVLVGVLGSGYFLAVGLLTILTAPSDARIVRGVALEQRSLPYVEAARTLGLSPRRIVFAHIWPNVLPISVSNAFLNFAFSLVALSALSFLGLGVGPGSPDWGRMLNESRTLLFDNPMAALAPGAMILATAASMNVVGDWIFERLADRGRAR